ncbi:MAG: hypothetical protein N3A56_06340 [Thermodesulfobacteriaceae bacterium]|nr:hypothetical protein [Thermodesulfobacteriaceae bacterium]
MELSLDLFFEKLNHEKVAELFADKVIWEPLKKLKEFLNDLIPELSIKIPFKNPLPESVFLTPEGEIVPFKELEEFEGEFFYKGEKIEGTLIYAGAILMDKKLYFEKQVIIEPFALLKGPCYLSKGTEVRHSAYLRGSIYTGEGAVIGHTTEVKNSIFLTQAKAAHFAYVGDSILGREVNLGAGTKLANLKFTQRKITFKINSQNIFTGLKKMGAILGDKTQTGCNSVLQPGTLIGKNSYIYPCCSAGPGYFPPRSKIKKSTFLK